MTMEVEIWADVVCPWCYLGKRRFERALASFEHRDKVQVTYRSFELDPAAPPGVTSPAVEMLAQKYGMTADRADQAQRQMEERAAADGLTFRMSGLRSGNTRDAHRLLQLAKASGRQDQLMERLQRAYFTEQDSIFDHDSLTRLAMEAGLDREEVSEVLAGDRYADHVDGACPRRNGRPAVRDRPPLRDLRCAAGGDHHRCARARLGGGRDMTARRGLVRWQP
jgi:predicted DsbA family dithiol-disulfide isomerase